MSSLWQFIPEYMMQHIGLALFHSIWQAAIVYFIFLSANRFLQKASATSRYYLAFFALLAMFILPFITLLKLPAHEVALTGGIDGNQTSYSLGDVVYVLADQQFDLQHYVKNIEFVLSSLAPWFVWFWMLGLIMMMIRLAGGYSLTYRLTRTNCMEAPVQWITHLQTMANTLSIHKKIRLLASHQIDIPMVIGHLKPVILVPVGTFTRLPYDQIEMILAHELAHIKRADFIINFLQSVVESILFFNPFVWLISQHIRAEREHACDDLALSVNGKNLSLAKALVSLADHQNQEINSNVILYFNKFNTMKRIERLFTNHRLKPTSFEKMMVITVSLMLVLLISASGTFSTAGAMNWPFQSTKNQTFNANSLHDPAIEPDSLKVVKKVEKIIETTIADTETTASPDAVETRIEIETFVTDEGDRKEHRIIKIINGDTIEQVFSDRFEFEFKDEQGHHPGKKFKKVYRFNAPSEDIEIIELNDSGFRNRMREEEFRHLMGRKALKADSMRWMQDKMAMGAHMLRDSMQRIFVVKNMHMADSIMKTVNWEEIVRANEWNQMEMHDAMHPLMAPPAMPERPARPARVKPDRFPDEMIWFQQKHNPYHRLLVQEMEQEGLASKGSTIILSKKQLIIDGKVMDKKTQKQILKRFESLTGEKINDDEAVTIH